MRGMFGGGLAGIGILLWPWRPNEYLVARPHREELPAPAHVDAVGKDAGDLEGARPLPLVERLRAAAIDAEQDRPSLGHRRAEEKAHLHARRARRKARQQLERGTGWALRLGGWSVGRRWRARARRLGAARRGGRRPCPARRKNVTPAPVPNGSARPAAVSPSARGRSRRTAGACAGDASAASSFFSASRIELTTAPRASAAGTRRRPRRGRCA